MPQLFHDFMAINFIHFHVCSICVVAASLQNILVDKVPLLFTS